MAVYDGEKSRAPIIPLKDKSKAVNGELILTEDDSEFHLIQVKEDSDGTKTETDLVRQVTDDIAEEMRETKQYKISEDEPITTKEQIWFKEEIFDNEEKTMQLVQEYEEGDEIHQL